jgi:hypothetical protein
MDKTRRKMSLGPSIANLGYHYAAWRHPDVPADGNMDFRHFVHCANGEDRDMALRRPRRIQWPAHLEVRSDVI